MKKLIIILLILAFVQNLTANLIETEIFVDKILSDNIKLNNKINISDESYSFENKYHTNYLNSIIEIKNKKIKALIDLDILYKKYQI